MFSIILSLLTIVVLFSFFVEIQLAFSKPSYTVDEVNIVVENLISVVKVNDRQTEQELEVFLQLAQGVGDGAAEYRKYN